MSGAALYEVTMTPPHLERDSGLGSSEHPPPDGQGLSRLRFGSRRSPVPADWATMGGPLTAEHPTREIGPSRTVSSPKAGGMDRGSESGHDEEAMVGVLPTLLPKGRNAELAKDQKGAICRENFDAPDRIRTCDLRFRRPIGHACKRFPTIPRSECLWAFSWMMPFSAHDTMCRRRTFRDGAGASRTVREGCHFLFEPLPVEGPPMLSPRMQQWDVATVRSELPR